MKLSIKITSFTAEMGNFYLQIFLSSFKSEDKDILKT